VRRFGRVPLAEQSVQSLEHSVAIRPALASFGGFKFRI
jgi:hypothetical protein